MNHAVGFCGNGSFVPSKDITSKLDIPFLNQKNIVLQMTHFLMLKIKLMLLHLEKDNKRLKDF